MNKILFIDDDKDIINLYRSLFKNKSGDDLTKMATDFFNLNINPIANDLPEYQASFATQGEEGVDIIKKELKSQSPIKVVFIDMRMPPGIDGVETAKRIRQLDKKIEIVFVTAYSDTNLEDVVNLVGHPDKLLYLKKPFDVVEIKQLALNLVVKYKNENIKEEFVSNITHELKTPLASILGFQELLASADIQSLEIKEYIAILGQNARLMKTLVEDLVSSMELLKPEIALYKNSVKLPDFIHYSYLSLRPLFKDSNLDFAIDIPDELNDITLEFDEVRIFECLNNLVSNAVKFTKQGRVLLGIKKVNGNVAIYVKDTGVGIDEQHHNQIFNKFFRIESQHHNTPGLGIGLNIVKKIMSLHSGEVKVNSKLGEGTEMQLVF